MLQNWPYHGLGRLGGIRQLSEKVTCLHPRDVGDTHPLLTVHPYASQEHAFKKVSVFNGICRSSTCTRHERRQKSHLKARCAAVAVFVFLRERDKYAFLKT